MKIRKLPANKKRNANSAAWFKAAAKGDLSKLQVLSAGGQPIDARDEAGKTALIRAAEGGHQAAVKQLLKAGADAKASITIRDSVWKGCNAVIFAAESGSAEIVELLLGAGASPNGKSSDDRTPLDYAVEHKSLRMVNALLQAGARPTKGAFVASVWDGHDEIALRLIASGANANVCDDLGQSALHSAAEQGRLELVRALIQAKAGLDHRANESTPLLASLQQGHADCALELISAGADVSAKGLLQRDALMTAAAAGLTEVVRALLKAGANPNAKDKEGKTALMMANDKPHVETVELLRAQGGDQSGYDIQEYIRAASVGDVECVRVFLDKGVDVNAVYANGFKALISAVRNGHTNVVRLLLERGAQATTVSTARAWGLAFDADALALAAEAGHVEIVRLLIRSGVDPNASRMFWHSALGAAAMSGRAEVIRELLASGVPLEGEETFKALRKCIDLDHEAAALVFLEAGMKLEGTAAADVLGASAYHGMVRMVKTLLAAGVDPRQPNQHGETPLKGARVRRHKNIEAILEQAIKDRAA